MEEEIKRITGKNEYPETKMKQEVSINYDGKQYFVRIPTKISEYLDLNKKQKMQFIVDIPYIEEKEEKIMVVKIIE